MIFTSQSFMIVVPTRRALRLADFFVRMCEWFALVRRTFPVPVRLKRLVAARLDFILGMSLLQFSRKTSSVQQRNPTSTGWVSKVGGGRIELPTPSVSGRCSPTELTAFRL